MTQHAARFRRDLSREFLTQYTKTYRSIIPLLIARQVVVSAPAPSSRDPLARLALAGLLALTVTEFLWEMLLAPLRPGGSWLALKALPLALLVAALTRGSRRAQQWLALLLPFYFAEAVVRVLTESGRHALVAGFAAVIAAVSFVALLSWARARRVR